MAKNEDLSGSYEFRKVKVCNTFATVARKGTEGLRNRCVVLQAMYMPAHVGRYL